MDNQIPNTVFTTELLDLLDETFERTQGIFLDRGHSLLETLGKLSADEASRTVSTGGATIAGHVEHVRYYLTVLESGILGNDFGIVDWDQSWKTKAVNTEEWQTLKQQLHNAYRGLISTIKGVNEWKGEDDIGGSLAILAHTAYHLGAIKQLLRKADK